MKEYLFISYTTIALLMAHNPTWEIQPLQTAYNYGNGKPVIVVDGRWIDSLGLRDWTDIMVQYPINLNDSSKVHKVTLNANYIK